MQLTLRILGGLGLVLCLVVLVASSYAAIRFDQTVNVIVQHATKGIDAAKEHAADARNRLQELTESDQPLSDEESEARLEERIELVERYEELLSGIDQQIDTVNVGLEKAVTVLDLIGSDVNGQRIQAGLEKLKKIETRVATLLDRIKSTTTNVRPNGTLRRAATRELATRTLKATREAILPAGSLLDELDQVANTANNELHAVQKRVRNTTIALTVAVIVISLWMALGQFALMRCRVTTHKEALGSDSADLPSR